MKAQTEVYQLYSDKLFGICLKYSRSYEDAEDILQDSFLKIFKKIHLFENKGSFEGWLKRITINTALEHYRKSKTSQSKIEFITEEEEELQIDEMDFSVDVLLKSIQQLPDKYRLVFNLYVLDEYSHKEISELLNISEGTSKSNLSRARSLLKKNLIALKLEK